MRTKTSLISVRPFNPFGFHLWNIPARHFFCLITTTWMSLVRACTYLHTSSNQVSNFFYLINRCVPGTGDVKVNEKPNFQNK